MEREREREVGDSHHKSTWESWRWRGESHKDGGEGNLWGWVQGYTGRVGANGFLFFFFYLAFGAGVYICMYDHVSWVKVSLGMGLGC